MEEVEIVKSHCNICGGKRNHFVLKREEKTEEEKITEYNTVWSWDCYEMLKCCGCSSISMRHRYSFSEYCDENGDATIFTTYYPPSVARRKPRWMDDISYAMNFTIDNIKELLEEIYVCLQNDAPRLAVMGVRSLIEHIIIDKVGDKGRFKKNVAEFEGAGYISKVQKDILEKALDAGHAVTHRSFKPDMTLVNDVLSITESLIETLYVLPSRSNMIANKTPERKK